jgi:Asp-tRNA(Asn)/Glu-tRNA(Gln) amidotransferase A subunit family amidase
MIMAHGFAAQLRFVARKPREEALFALGTVIEQAAGRFAPEPWWRRD